MIFRKWGGGSKAVWNFSENSSVLETPSFPMCYLVLPPAHTRRGAHLRLWLPGWPWTVSQSPLLSGSDKRLGLVKTTTILTWCSMMRFLRTRPRQETKGVEGVEGVECHKVVAEKVRKMWAARDSFLSFDQFLQYSPVLWLLHLIIIHQSAINWTERTNWSSLQQFMQS